MNSFQKPDFLIWKVSQSPACHLRWLQMSAPFCFLSFITLVPVLTAGGLCVTRCLFFSHRTLLFGICRIFTTDFHWDCRFPSKTASHQMFLYQATHARIHLKNGIRCWMDNHNTINTASQLTITFSIHQNQNPFACSDRQIQPGDKEIGRQQWADRQMM